VIKKLVDIVERDRSFFDALGRVLAAGHRLVLTLGNHDIELAFPAVRAALDEMIGAGPGTDFRFIFDGEAYVVGDALIEHGNRYDAFNVVNFNDLRQLRSIQSRRMAVPSKWEMDPPPGSFMVSRVINPIKESYRFIDLLKPETGAVIPILLALEPGYRSIIREAAKQALRSKVGYGLDAPNMPSIGGDISSTGGDDIGLDELGGDISGGGSSNDPLAQVLSAELGDDAGQFLETLDTEDSIEEMGGDISSLSEKISHAFGMTQLLLAGKGPDVDKRLPALLRALRVLQDDKTFDESVETEATYLEAARALARDGSFRYVIFGHTHLAKNVALDDGAVYLNSGTWADLIRFPQDVIEGDKETAIPKLREFVDQLQKGELAEWIDFRPTYVRLDVGDDGKVTEAGVHEYRPGEAP
jgi:UDP-2,3-diacylglucosamine pyrophosphatase LpxH